MGKGFVGKLDHFFQWISRFALLNMLWIVFSAAGLFVIGFFPATASLFTVARKWVQGKDDLPLAKTFYHTYKAVFVQANLYGWVMIAIGGVLYMNYQAIVIGGMNAGAVVVFAYILLVAVYLLTLVSMLPVFVHYEGSFVQIVQKTLLFVVGRVHLSALFLIMTGSAIYLSLAFPALILFFSGSVLAYGLMWFFVHAMESLEQKKLALESS